VAHQNPRNLRKEKQKRFGKDQITCGSRREAKEKRDRDKDHHEKRASTILSPRAARLARKNPKKRRSIKGVKQLANLQLSSW